MDSAGQDVSVENESIFLSQDPLDNDGNLIIVLWLTLSEWCMGSSEGNRLKWMKGVGKA